MTRGGRSSSPPISVAGFRRRLLRWSAENHRHFLWRRRRVTAWQVLVSEFFLRKTSAPQADPVIREVLRLAPNPAALLRVRRERLARIVRPLGLQNVRAKAIREIAQTLVRDHGGRVPRDPEALLGLPHVGRYMVNSVRTVAFGDPQPIVDANIMRILHRVFGQEEAIEVHRADRLWDFAARLLPRRDPEQAKRINWALVDFGALVCRARSPLCAECPMRRDCPWP
ncbi:A/G-specific adenine glycosylase [Candidatus Sumerlaeota bacterium]|nr:A/G-specific adenine glycosylase [Candidatus Sumerlaeota bacterium]